VAYIDENGQTYLDALEAELFPPASLENITAVYSGGSVMAGTDVEELRDDLTVTAHYDDGTSEEVTTYTLSGTISENPSAVTVHYSGKTALISVPVLTLASISAVYTQSRTVYDTDTLDSLRSDLVVTAHYSNSSTATVTDYTLSGTLAKGTSTVTVRYGGKTTTFTVAVSSEIDWEDGVTYDVSVYQPILSNQYWSQGRLVSYNGWDATQSVNCYTASQLYIDRVSGSNAIPDGRYNVFLASDGTTVLGLFSTNVDSSSTATRKIINVPAGAKYFSLSESRAQIERFTSGVFTITPHA
jgi:hypothetical protein